GVAAEGALVADAVRRELAAPSHRHEPDRGGTALGAPVALEVDAPRLARAPARQRVALGQAVAEGAPLEGGAVRPGAARLVRGADRTAMPAEVRAAQTQAQRPGAALGDAHARRVLRERPVAGAPALRPPVEVAVGAGLRGPAVLVVHAGA